jgi:hypothetical protein
VSTCTIVSFFSRIALREDQGGIWQHETKQNKEKKNGIGRNGRAGRFAMVFFLFIFNFQVSLPLSFCLAWCSFLVQVETNKQTRLRACYFSFFLPLGIACLL